MKMEGDATILLPPWNLSTTGKSRSVEYASLELLISMNISKQYAVD